MIITDEPSNISRGIQKYYCIHGKRKYQCKEYDGKGMENKNIIVKIVMVKEYAYMESVSVLLKSAVV